MILWPHVLPQYLLVDGYQEQAGDGLLRTPMDVGPAKVRRRVTAVPRPLSGEIIVTPAQLNFFKYWYNNVLFGGSLRFGWVDPWSDTVLTNLITNGGFDVNTDGWIPYLCTGAIISGGVYGNCLEITSTVSATAVQTIATIIDKTYQLSTACKSGTSGNEDAILLFGNSPWPWVHTESDNITTSAEWKRLSISFAAQYEAYDILIYKNSSTPGTMLFDEVSLVDITSGIVEMRFVEPPAWSAIDPQNIRISMKLEILP